jgi:hypothetical protein
MRKNKLIQYYTALIHLLKLFLCFFVMLNLRIFTKLAIHLVLDHSVAGFLSALHTVLLKKIEKT